MAMNLHDLRGWYPQLTNSASSLPPPPPMIPATVIDLPDSVIQLLSLAFPTLLSKLYFAEMRATSGEANHDVVWQRFLATVAAEASANNKFKKFETMQRGLVDLRQILESKIFSSTEADETTSPVFLRLTTRSPKDALLAPATAGVTDADAALRLLCSSNRLAEDTQKYLVAASNSASSNLPPPALVVRPFLSIVKNVEARVFCHEGKVTAISQYSTFVDDPAVIERLLAGKIAILELVMERVLPRLTPPTAVIDVGLVFDERMSKNHVWTVIELNPFEKSTQGCLFSWVVDREILFGEKPFEFRVKQQ